MLELYLEALAALLLLALASYRLRRDAGIDERTKTALRGVAVMLFMVAAWRAGVGAGIVHLLVAASLAAVTLVLLLSAGREWVARLAGRLLGSAQRG